MKYFAKLLMTSVLILSCFLFSSIALAEEAAPPRPPGPIIVTCGHFGYMADIICMYNPTRSKWSCSRFSSWSRGDLYDVNESLAPKIKSIVLQNMQTSSKYPQCSGSFEVRVEKYLPQKFLRFFADFASESTYATGGRYDWDVFNSDFEQKVAIDLTNAGL
jgi:hypothetical protein